jgi:hypothetical protein
MTEMTSWDALKGHWTKRLAPIFPVYGVSAALGVLPQKLLSTQSTPGAPSGELHLGRRIAGGNDGAVFYAYYTVPQSGYACLCSRPRLGLTVYQALFSLLQSTFISCRLQSWHSCWTASWRSFALSMRFKSTGDGRRPTKNQPCSALRRKHSKICRTVMLLPKSSALS